MTMTEWGPSSQNNFMDAALLPGRTFSDPAAPNGGVSVTLNSVSAAGANLTITFGSQPPAPCQRSNAGLSISPAQTQWVMPAGSATYTVSLTNNDSANCGASDFDFTAAPTNGITARFASLRLRVSPGATATTSITLTSPETIGAAIYYTPVTATNAAATAYRVTVNTSLGILVTCVKSHPEVTLSPSSQILRVGSTVTYTATVKNLDMYQCAPAPFNLSAAVPGGWGLTASKNLSSVTLNPGESRSFLVNVSAAANTPINTYPLSVSAVSSTGNGRQATGTATVTVQP